MIRDINTIESKNIILIPASSRVLNNDPLKKNCNERKVNTEALVATETKGVAAVPKNSIRKSPYLMISSNSALKAIGSCI